MNTVLALLGDELLRQRIGVLLERENLAPLLPRDLDTGLEQLCRERPQLVIADLPLAEIHGADLCRQIRASSERTPIIFLGTAADPVEAVLLLELGADDYLVKPFHERELQARIRAVLRRTANRVQSSIRFGDVEVDFERRNVTRRGEEVKVTRGEYNLLHFFVRHADRPLTRNAILKEVWGYESYTNTRTVDIHVVKLRSKLEPEPRAPRHFLTIHGVGYRFRMEPAATRQARLSTSSFSQVSPE
jgi:DNA-binding response OmpR family regulator